MLAQLKVMALFAVMVGLLLFVGLILGSYFGNPYMTMGIFLIIAIIFNAISYFYSGKLVLRAYRARIIEGRGNNKIEKKLYDIVQGVALKADVPMPKVAIIPTDNPNAFATGRNPKNAVVAATEGILRILNDEELEGVIAHEMAHVKDRDILVMSVAATMAAAIAIIARVVLFRMMFGGRRDINPLLLIAVAITAPIAAILIQMAISRSREYKADKVGAMTIGKPWALANALQKLDRGNKRFPMKMGSPASSSLFIVNPFSGGAFVRIFSTHPPMEERIRRLRNMV